MEEKKRPSTKDNAHRILGFFAFAVFKDGVTVDGLVKGPESDPNLRTYLAASECRRALGWLYGRGLIRVSEVRNGQEVWVRCDAAIMAIR